MAKKRDRDKDAESGLQVLTVLCIFWTIGFFYWSRDGTILGMDAGRLSFICCSTINVLLIIVFLGTWISTRKENRVKSYLAEHFRSSTSISVDEIASKFQMKRRHVIRSLNSWASETDKKWDYDETTGLFVMQVASPVSDTSIEKNVDEL